MNSAISEMWNRFWKRVGTFKYIIIHSYHGNREVYVELHAVFGI